MSAHDRNCPKLPWMIDFYSTKHGHVPINQLNAAYANDHLTHLKNLNFNSIPNKRTLTSIMCTIGPTTANEDVLEELIEKGMCIARLKMPFYTRTDAEIVVNKIRDAADNYSLKFGTMISVAIALDLRGPEIRTGLLKNSSIKEIDLIAGRETIITSDPSFEEHVTPEMIYVDYQKINEIVEPGDRFFLDNNVTLSALEIVGSFIRCIIEKAGAIGDRVSVTLENSVLELPSVSEVEVQYAKDLNVDIVIVSCVRDPASIQQVRTFLGESGASIMVIAKIEDSIGVKNIDSILNVSDGILISRSDLANEIPIQKLFIVQKMIIAACNKVGKPVIVAPQILETMVNSPSPKKSEVMDAANAVIDGADCLMLSRETSTGQYAIEAVQILSDICREAEAAQYQKQIFSELCDLPPSLKEPVYVLAMSAVEASMRSAAAAIILLTTSGRIAKVLSHYRPRCPILAVTRYPRVARQLKIFRAVDPILFIPKPLEDWNKDVRRRVQFAITYGKYCNYIRAADVIIILTGCRPGSGFTNCLNLFYASDFDTIETHKQDEKVQKISLHL